MYFLRRKDSRTLIKSNGETEMFISDRAIFKHKLCDKYYIQTFYCVNDICRDEYLQLYLTDSLHDIIELKEVLYKYCGEWFDIYDKQLNVIHIINNNLVV